MGQEKKHRHPQNIVVTSLHEANIPDYVRDIPYVKEYDDGTVDYCLGANYEDAGKVVRTLLKIQEERAK